MDWVNSLSKISNKCKFQLFGRGYQNLLHLYALFGKVDPQFSGALPDATFNSMLNQAGVFLTTQEIRSIRDAFKQLQGGELLHQAGRSMTAQEIKAIQVNFPNQEGIAYRVFVDFVRNDLTQKRVAAIDHVFQQYEKGGRATLKDLIGGLDLQRHPHVRSLTKKAEKVRGDIEAGLRYWSSDGQTLTHEQFSEYCKDVNACVPLEREDFFIDLLVHGFGLFEKGVTLQRIQELEVAIFQKVRQRTEIKKDEGWRSSNAFKFLDIEQKAVINYQRFVGVLERIGCKFIDKECKAIFYKHSGGRDLLDYESFCGLLFHMGSGIKDNTNVAFELARSANGNVTTHGMTKRLH